MRGRGAARPARGLRLKGSGFVLDPNLRPALGPVQDQVERLRPLLAYADVLILGLDEAGPLFGTEDPAAVVAAAGGCEVVIKAGANGCFVPYDGGIVHLPSMAAEVVDPVGAGDAFAGGYLAARLSGAEPVAAARLGSRLAAGVMARPGDVAGLLDTTTAAIALAEALA